MARSRETYRKVITSPELTEQINPKNIQLMERFLKNFATKHSPQSVIVYKSNIIMFFTWNLLNNDNKWFIDIRKIEMMDFFDYALTELHWSPNRYANMHSTLSSFSEWIENYLDDIDEYKNFRNIVKKIEKPIKDTVREKTVLSKNDINLLFDTLHEQKRYQEECLLALAISCGARVSELASFELSLIDENNTAFDGLFLETTRQIKTKGRGKQGKLLYKYILKDMFWPHYNIWLEEREKIMELNEQNHDSLFITKKGKPADNDRLRDWVNSWSDIVGKPCYPHNFRHYNISFLKSLGIEDDLIVFLTGWAEGTGHNMIAIYDDTDAKDKRWKNLDKLRDALKSQEN